MKTISCAVEPGGKLKLPDWAAVGSFLNAEAVDAGMLLAEDQVRLGVKTGLRALVVEYLRDQAQAVIHGFRMLSHLYPEPGNTGRLRGSLSCGKGYQKGATGTAVFKLPDGREVLAETITLL